MLNILSHFLGRTGGSAVHKPSKSSSSPRPQGLSKAGSSRSDKGNSKRDAGTRPSGSHRSEEGGLGNKKLEMKISSKKASSGSHRYFIFTSFTKFYCIFVTSRKQELSKYFSITLIKYCQYICHRYKYYWLFVPIFSKTFF